MAKDVIQRLKFEYQDTGLRKCQQGVRSLQGQFRNLNGVLGQLGGSLGSLGGQLGSVTSALGAMGGGYTAVAAAVVGATAAFVNYNVQLEKTDQMVQTVTGAHGKAAEEITDSIMSISKVYNTDLKETLNGVNALMAQFGMTGKEATDLVRDGFQGMMDGNQGKFLQLLQQYGPAFRDMGVSARQLAAIIHQTEGGIFGPEGMAAIQMAGRQMRLMSSDTSKALQSVGIDADDLKKKIQTGSVSTIDAVKMVAGKIRDLGPQTSEAGRVMQAVFGRMSNSIGTEAIGAIADLNTNLDETKKQTGELGQSIADLEAATNRMNGAMRNAFGTDYGFQVMGNNIKTYLTDTMTGALVVIGKVRGVLQDVSATISEPIKNEISTEIKSICMQTDGLWEVYAALMAINALRSAGQNYSDTVSEAVGRGNAGVKGAANAVSALVPGKGNDDNETKCPTCGKPISQCPYHGVHPKKTHTTKKSGSSSGHKSGGSSSSSAFEPAALSNDSSAGRWADYLMKQEQERKQKKIDIEIGARPVGDMDDQVTNRVNNMIEQITADIKPIDIPLVTNLSGSTGYSPAKDAKETAAAWSAASQAMNNAGAALQNMEDPGAKVAGIVMQAIANIALGFAQASASPATGAAGVFGWIAAATAGVATMTATIAQIKSATKSYAEGGWVGSGGGFVGDAVPAFLNKGEYVMSASDVETANSNLQSAYAGGGGGKTTISGEQLVTVINNYGKRTGRGEILR